MGFRALAASMVSGTETPEPEPREERRLEPRHDCIGLKLVIRDKAALGILHLRNLSMGGVCGLTDMPLPPGSVVHAEITKGHFHGAEVIWVNRMTIGLQFLYPLSPEMLDQLLSSKRPPNTTK
jgi:hypothetical protein